MSIPDENSTTVTTTKHEVITPEICFFYLKREETKLKGDVVQQCLQPYKNIRKETTATPSTGCDREILKPASTQDYSKIWRVDFFKRFRKFRAVFCPGCVLWRLAMFRKIVKGLLCLLRLLAILLVLKHETSVVSGQWPRSKLG